MALDFAGIENVGEFYSGHYLSAVLEGDLKTLFEKWRKAKEDDGKRLPNEALAGLSNRYFTARSKAEEEADPAERLVLAQEFHAYFLEALGYERQPDVEPMEGDEVIPVHLSLRRDGNPFLWVVDAPFPMHDDEDPLASPPLTEQLSRLGNGARLPRSAERAGQPATWREILDNRIFRIDRSPRWILFLTGSEALLIERHKWPQGKYLRFELDELFRRKQVGALRAMAGLLHREVLAPESGVCIHDILDENSHKHAYAVSGDLKHGVRRAVELLANEAVYYRREVQKQGVFNDEAFAGKLTSESLTWLYRLLFMFYVEARGNDLEAVPMDSDAYRKGYSLDSLRDLELVPLTTEHARNGFFLHDSLKTLFRILNMGFPEIAPDEGRTHELRLFTSGDMWIDALNSPLFDDERLELLKGVRFRNHILQEVLRLLSLSGEKKRKSRGRISYAQLGINQLGAVYEGLLSYTGFFASEDLYEVAAEDDCEQLSGKPAAEREVLKTYFVPASRIGDYREGEIVRDENSRKVVHKKGTFIFRLAGRNREKSASYYTPEVLTRCLVKYALKESLWEVGEGGEKPKRKKSADEILALTICEPAMGSSAFLIEAVDQLADAYLEVRQEERGETLPPQDYQREKRRVKARFATNNCYGVDLNPTAVELAKVSLWLATLYEGGKCPWFGLRLATGNSLVGARREVFKTADVIRKGSTDYPNWLSLIPAPISLHHGKGGPHLDEDWIPPSRPKDTIYHFLLPAEGMVAFDKDKVVQQLAPESVKRIKGWRKDFCRPFNKKDAKRLEQISDAVDRLFAQAVRERVLATQETSDRIPVWGESAADKQIDLFVRDQEKVAASLEDGRSAYRRLKLAMDAWCALWFWPIEEAELLPDRPAWLAQMELILKGQVTNEPTHEQWNLFTTPLPTAQEQVDTEHRLSGKPASQDKGNTARLARLQTLSDTFRDRRANYSDECGLADVDMLLNDDATLATVQRTAEQLHFHHWELRFAEIFASKKGFDLIVGNPPWLKLQWAEQPVLSDYDPQVAVRRLGPKKLAERRELLLGDSAVHSAYLVEFSGLTGIQAYLGALCNYHLLQGTQPSIDRCFVTRTWELSGENGAIGLLHPESLFDDPRGGVVRSELYSRLSLNVRFVNELRLFPEVGHQKRFTLNIYRSSARSAPHGLHMSNVYHPSTIDLSWHHDGRGAVPLIKDEFGNWELRGHLSRIVRIDLERLKVFASLFGDENSRPLEARLPVIHSEEVAKVLDVFSAHRHRLGDLGERFLITRMFEETDAQRDGTIRRETRFPESIADWIISGPHFFVGTPLYRNPNEICETKGAYTRIDLASVDPRWIPRTNFVPTENVAQFQSEIPKWRGRPITDSPRLLNRMFVNPVAERTLISAIIPPGPSFINTSISTLFEDLDVLLYFAGLSHSVPFDFFVKVSGKTHVMNDILTKFPLPRVDVPIRRWLQLRAMVLNCVTDHYAGIWQSGWLQEFTEDRFTNPDSRVSLLSRSNPNWNRSSAVRKDLERRLALVECDVLAAIALGIREEDLVTIYRAQFPILRQYEDEQVYDQHGRIVPASKTASGNAAVSLVELAATLKEQAGFDVHGEYHPDGSKTRELQMRQIHLGKREAEVLGVSERCTVADLLAETEVRWSVEDHPEGRPVQLVGLRYTDPGLEPRMERVYPTPWTRCDREADYRQAWAEFERRLGKKMPEGTPL